MSDATIELEALDDFEDDTLVDLHVFAEGRGRTEADTTRLVDFAELARLLDHKATV